MANELKRPDAEQPKGQDTTKAADAAKERAAKEAAELAAAQEQAGVDDEVAEQRAAAQEAAEKQLAADRESAEKAAKQQEEAEGKEAAQRQLEERMAELDKREQELADREAAAKAAPQQVVQVVPGQNFNMQNAMQQDANSRARKLRTNEMPGGTVFTVPVIDPLTGQVNGWKKVNGKGERVNDDGEPVDAKGNVKKD